MVLYRIYTEDRNRSSVIFPIVDDLFSGFTIYGGVGYWRGRSEACLIIEIIAEKSRENDVREIARLIREHNAQESVAITMQDVTVTTVGEKI